jgi:hypothetical protein
LNLFLGFVNDAKLEVSIGEDFLKIAFFFPAILIDKAGWDKSEGFQLYFFLPVEKGLLVFAWGLSCQFLEQSGERTNAFEAYLVTGVRDHTSLLKEDRRFFYADFYQILVRRSAIDVLKKPDEMVFRKIRFVSNVIEVDVF